MNIILVQLAASL